MTICFNCAKECEDVICGDCLKTADMEGLCKRILDYDTQSLSDYTLDKAAAGLMNESNIRLAVFRLCEFLPGGKKLYYRMLSIKGKGSFIPKAAGAWFFESAPEMLSSDELSEEQKQTVEGLLLSSYMNEYRYDEAEKTAQRLCTYGTYSTDVGMKLGDYFIRTRRYDKADEILNKLLAVCTDETKREYINQSLEDSQKRRLGKAKGGIAEYLPAAYENRLKYKSFLETLGIEVFVPEPKAKKVIPKPMEEADYPEFADERKAGFQSFVAYDVETTGLNPKFDSIIEIGAVKVRDGVITERFQRFAKPFKKSISEKITELTGITADMVKDADDMWNVFGEFADFVGDDILVGYNNRLFDNKFLMRAGRYANRIMKNSSFDVMFLAADMKDKLSMDKSRISLGELSEKLGIENPQAHRALADAETTAKVYLALIGMGGYENTNGLDDILNDDWE